jgi:hypothetical protein
MAASIRAILAKIWVARDGGIGGGIGGGGGGGGGGGSGGTALVVVMVGVCDA